MGHQRARTRSALLAVVLGLLVLGVVGAVPGEPGNGPKGQAGCSGRTLDGAVTVVSPPVFPTPPAGLVDGRRGRLVDLAVQRWSGARAWVTDGWSIARTDDAGCSWDVVFSLDDVGDTAAVEPRTAAIVALATPDVQATEDVLYVLFQDLSVPQTSARFGLLVTEDGGGSFVVRGGGIAPVNLGADADACGADTACDLVATSDPSVVYLRFAGPDRTLVYRSLDGGQNFEGRNAVTEFGSVTPENGPPGPQPVLTDLAVDPLDLNRMWGTSATSGPNQSHDGGAAFTHYEPFEHFQLPLTDIRHVELLRFGLSPVVVVAGVDESGNPRLAYSGDEGQFFQPVPENDRFTGDVSGLTVTDTLGVVVASSGGVFLRPFGPGARQYTGPTHPNLRELQAVHAGVPAVTGFGVIGEETVWGINDREIIQLEVVQPDPPRIELEFDGADLDGQFDPLGIPDLVPGRLRGVTNVKLAVGERMPLDYLLEVPPVATAVDVFFLIDETGSMQDEFDALALGIDRIANDLKDAGVDVNVGLGTYGNGFRYHRYRAIGPVDEEFLNRLESIRAGGDGEVAYTGLHQVITGSGLKRSLAGNGVRAGQDAQWRENTIRMVVHATDEELNEEPEGPTKELAIALLQGAGVKHLGLISNEPVPQGLATVADWEPMFELARQTGALAPIGGIDCDSDGLTDVREGDPIACFLSPATTNETIAAVDRADLIPDLATVIINMLEAETLNARVRFNQSRSRLVTGFSPLGPTVADFRRPVVLPARAAAVCTQDLAGLRETVTLTATATTRTLGGVAVNVACGERDAEPTAAGVVPPVAVAVGASPASPPAPIQAPSLSQGAAQSGVQSVASSNSFVPQAGAAAAQQEQHQAQQALIGRDQDQAGPEAAFQFSARRDRDAATPVTLAAGMLMAAGAGLALRRQRAAVDRRIHVRR